MSCTFRLRTKGPDGKWQDLEFEELLKEDGPKSMIEDLNFGEMDALLGLTPDGQGGFRLSTNSKDGALYDPNLADLAGEGLDGLLGFEEDGQGGFRLATESKDGALYDPTMDQLLDGTVYTEVERQTEQVVVGEDPNTVTIERMTSVTFEGPGGGKLTLQFNNPPA